jgi:hypothetical protein
LQHTGLGGLIAETLEPRIYFCPSDGNFNLSQELPKIGTPADAYGSYLYRQLDQLPVDAAAGQLDRLGRNEIGGQIVAVEALALDMNSLGPPPYHQTNHDAQVVNVLFRDTAVRAFRNVNNIFAIPAEAFADPLRIPSAIDQILVTADYAYVGRPADAPHVQP